MPVHLRAFNCCIVVLVGPRVYQTRQLSLVQGDCSCFRGYCKPSPKPNSTTHPVRPSLTRKVDLSEAKHWHNRFPHTFSTANTSLGWNQLPPTGSHPPPPACETSSCFLFSPFWRTVRSLFPMGGLGIPSGWKRFKASRVGVRTQLLATSLVGRPLSSALFLLLFGASCTKHARKFVGTFSTRQCIWRFFQWLATCWFEQIPCPSRLHPTSYQVLVLQWVKQTNVAQIYHTNLSGSRWCLASWDKPLINQRNPAPETTEHF